jgi:hypothetical protein
LTVIVLRRRSAPRQAGIVNLGKSEWLRSFAQRR